MNKNISILAAILLTAALLATAAIPVFAADPASFDLGTTYAESGGEAVVSFRVSGNPGISTFKFKITFSEELSFLGASAGAILSNSGTFDSKVSGNVVTVMWYRADASVAGDGEIAILRFAVPAGAAEGVSFPLTVTFDPDDILNNKIDPVPAIAKGGAIVVRNSHGTFAKGDVNGDGDVNMKDVLFLRKIVAGIVAPTPAEAARADVNGDGDVNMKDVLLLRKIVAGVEE